MARNTLIIFIYSSVNLKLSPSFSSMARIISDGFVLIASAIFHKVINLQSNCAFSTLLIVLLDKISLIIFVQIFFSNYAEGINNPKPTIAIDLDGVLNNYTVFKKNNIPDIKEGAEEFVKSLSNDYQLILFTNRSPKLATKWLIQNNLDNYFIEVTNIKPMALIYLDDRAINFDGDYSKALYEIRNFKVYWKNN